MVSVTFSLDRSEVLRYWLKIRLATPTFLFFTAGSLTAALVATGFMLNGRDAFLPLVVTFWALFLSQPIATLFLIRRGIRRDASLSTVHTWNFSAPGIAVVDAEGRRSEAPWIRVRFIRRTECFVVIGWSRKIHSLIPREKLDEKQWAEILRLWMNGRKAALETSNAQDPEVKE